MAVNGAGSRRRFSLAAALLACLPLCPLSVQADEAQGYPKKPVSLVVPYPAGGVADQFARSMASELGKRLGQSVIVENRPGANGNIGSALVAKQAADGYTLLLGSTSTLAVNPHLYKNMGYDPVQDLQPITLTHQMPNVLIVNAGTPYRSVADVIAAAKKAPGQIAFGSAGNGNSMHLAGVLFQKQAGIELMHVPYQGAPPALTDVMGGATPMMFINLPAVVGYQKSNKIRILAVTDTKRANSAPGVPTFSEAGVDGVVSRVWNGLLVRQGTPDAIVKKLNTEIVAILTDPAFRKPLEEQGYEVLSSSAQEFSDLLNKDLKAMGKLIEAANIKLD